MATPKLETRIRQEQILQAALEVIGEEGVQGLSVARVAAKVGVVPSALYRHFPSKEAIIDGLLEMVGRNLKAFVQESCATASDAPDCLHRLLVRHLQFLKDHPAIPRLVFSEEVIATHPGHRQRIREVVEGYLDDVADRIRAGQQNGSLRGDLDAAALARLFLGLIQPAVILWSVSDGEFDLDRHGREVWAMYQDLVRPPSGNTSSE